MQRHIYIVDEINSAGRPDKVCHKETIVTRDEICKGCKNHKTLCTVPHERNGNPCPCSLCLVKGICNEDVLCNIALNMINKQKKENAI